MASPSDRAFSFRSSRKYRVVRTHIFYLLRGCGAATYERRNALRAGTLTRAIFDQDDAGRLELLLGSSIIAVIGAALR